MQTNQRFFTKKFNFDLNRFAFTELQILIKNKKFCYSQFL